MSDKEKDFNGAEEIETKTFPLNYSDGCFILINEGQFDFINIHSIKFYPKEFSVEINFLNRKTKRKEEKIENEKIKPKNKLYKRIIEFQKSFCDKNEVKKIIIGNEYKTILESFLSKNLFNKVDSPYGIPCEEIELIYEKYNFIEFIEKIQISPNLKNEKIYIQPNSIFQKIFGIIKENKPNQNNIIFIGEGGMGKSYSIYLSIFLLRLNPLNFIISILDYEYFKKDPKEYFMNEIIFYISFLYYSKPEIKEIENVLKDLINFEIKEKSFHDVLFKFSDLFNFLINEINLEINLFLFIDSYENCYNDNDINFLINQIENLKQNANGFLNRNFDSHYKIVKIISSNYFESNKLIIEVIGEMKKKFKNNQEILLYGIIFLSTSILSQTEILYYIKRKFNQNIIPIIDKNYSIIDFLFDCNFKNDEQNYLKIIEFNYEKQFFYNIKQNKLNQREYLQLILNLFCYRTICNSISIPTFSFFNGKYKNYYYFFLIPLPDGKDNIIFEFKNIIIENFITNFNFDGYYKSVDFSQLDLNYFTDLYNQTELKVLKGILLEEMLYIILKKYGERKTLNLQINYFAKDENNSDYQKQLILNIPKVVKSLCREKDIFERENLFSIEVDLNRDGLYFFSHKFPIIDAVIINYPDLYLIQIKKTLMYEYIYQINKDFHLFNLLIDDEQIYRELLKYNNNFYRNNNQLNTKLSVWLKIANYKRINPKLKIHYMFLYKNQEYSRKFNRDYNEMTILDEFNQKKESINIKHISCSTLIENINNGKYYYSNKDKILYIVCNSIQKNIILCQMEDFIKEICDDQLKDYFSQLVD